MTNLPMRAAHRVLVSALLVSCGSVLAMAASLTLATHSLGAAQVATPRCTSAGLGVIPNLSGANVISVTVSGLPVACGSATIQVTVSTGAAFSSGSGTVPAAGGSVTVALGSGVASVASSEIDLVVTGP